VQRCHQRDDAETALQFLTKAGAEIGVASTKAFTTQLVGLYLLANAIAKAKGRLSPEREQARSAAAHLPAAVGSVLALERTSSPERDLCTRRERALPRRGLHYPIALEARLSSRRSATSTPRPTRWRAQARPLALVEAMPVVTVAPNDELLEKLKSNMQEVRPAAGTSTSSRMPTRR